VCFPLSKSKRAHAKHFGANICHLKHRLFAPLLRPEDLCYRPEARLLRMVCGATCNCTDPYTNAWWKVTWMQCVKPFLHLKICTHCCQRWWFGNGNSFKTQQFGLFTCSSCLIQNIYTEKIFNIHVISLLKRCWWDISHVTEVPATGCQPTCLSLATDQLKLPGSCKDQPSNRAWNETWDTYIPAMKFVIGFLVRI